MNSDVSTPSAPAVRQVFRFEVRPAEGQPDPLGDQLLTDTRDASLKLDAVHTARIYFIAGLPDDEAMRDLVARELLADPVAERVVYGAASVEDRMHTIEVHYQPGVMDPVANSAQQALAELLSTPVNSLRVMTGFRYDLLIDSETESYSEDELSSLARRYLANPVIQEIHLKPWTPDSFPEAAAHQRELTHVRLMDLDDAALQKLSREGHLFLSLEEMQALQAHFKSIGRDPTDIELETFAQTWSEHCVHKTLKSKVRYRQSVQASATGPGIEDFANRPGHSVEADGTLVIDNLLKSTIAAATHELMQETDLGDWCVSVFEDNAGIVKFDETDGVCIKVETHNHPSAIEPYGGAATGIGGCIRDIMGTGQFAWPIANTDVFCVADPRIKQGDLPKGVIHPRRILEQVVAGVRDYGNRKGIPTVNGSVYFHDDYLGNPLVFAGSIGLMPLDKAFGQPQPGDSIVALGGRTGRDGIHGATFSSAELTDSHSEEFGHAVQIGDPITQKKVMDVILQARDHEAGCLFTAITDCGAGGFSSAVGEMGEKVGAEVFLDRAPLKYAGLNYDEIWISEAQERMVLSVSKDKLPVLEALCHDEHVELCVLGKFGHADKEGNPELILHYHDTEVGRLPMPVLHDGIPKPRREAVWHGSQAPAASHTARKLDHSKITDALYALLSHPNIASKHWIIRQYDHEVQGGSVVKPLTGVKQDGPSDAAVLRPKLSSTRGIAIGSGLQTGMGEKTPGGDSYWMTLSAIDEAVRNLVCVGADPSRIAILDNFCWPSCDKPEHLGSLVRAAEACYDGAKAYKTPFVSGKDSLNNQFTTDDGKVITIPPTLLITAMGIVPDVNRCVTMDAKQAGNMLLMLGTTGPAMAGSHHARLRGGCPGDDALPQVDLEAGPRTAALVAQLIAQGHVASAHDVSDGGMLVAAAEMAFAGRLGLNIVLENFPGLRDLPLETICFSEAPSRYLLEVAPQHLGAVSASLMSAGLSCAPIGAFDDHDRLVLRLGELDTPIVNESLNKLRQAWLNPLDW